MSVITLQLPNSVYEVAQNMAKQDDTSFDAFVTLAIAEKVQKMRDEMRLSSRAKQGDKQKFMNALSKVADSEPLPYDTL